MTTWKRCVKAHSQALAQKCERIAGQRLYTSCRLLQPKTFLRNFQDIGQAGERLGPTGALFARASSY
jgi:hypothetical protein